MLADTIGPETITRYVVGTFDGVTTAEAAGATFFFVDPQQMIPFATIVTRDNAYDHASHLDRPGVYRLNVGVGKATFEALAGPGKPPSAEDGTVDFTVLDRIIPHPMYGQMHWLCVLNPGPATFEATKPLLAEAYERDMAKHAKRTPVPGA